MDKFRVISDLHIDINHKFPIAINDDVFTVICGDTSGTPAMTIDWVKNNVKYGVGVSGNHLPYNDLDRTVQELREELACAFPNTSTFTYLDVETGTFSKEVDGILFVGTCMYTDMLIKNKRWNPNGDQLFNMKCSEYHMNDYRLGIKTKDYFLGTDNEPKLVKLTAEDYVEWFKNAYGKIEQLLNDNESASKPKDVVLFTHHPLIADFLMHSWYIDNSAYSYRDYNWASYASDMKDWVLRHTSVKCYCCGHIHAVDKDWQTFDISREDGSKILVVNNARGYVRHKHDKDFNKDLFVNTKTWKVSI